MEVDHLAEFLDDIETSGQFDDQLRRLRSAAPPLRRTIVRSLAATAYPQLLISALIGQLRNSPHISPLGAPSGPPIRSNGSDGKGVDVLTDTDRERFLRLLLRVLQTQPRRGADSPVVEVAPELLAFLKQRMGQLKMQLNTGNRTGTNKVSGTQLRRQLDETELIAASLAQLIGLRSFVAALRPTFDKQNEQNANAAMLAVAASTVGPGLVVPLLRALLAERSVAVAQLGLAVLPLLPRRFGAASLLPVLPALVELTHKPLGEPGLSTGANVAIAALADAVKPLGWAAFAPRLPVLWNGARRRRGRAGVTFMRSLVAVTALVDRERQPEIAKPVLELAMQRLAAVRPASDETRDALGVAVDAAAYVDSARASALLDAVFARFWDTEVAGVATDPRTALAVARATAALPQVGRSRITQRLVASGSLQGPPAVQLMALQTLAALGGEPLVLDARTEQKLVEGLLRAVAESEVEEDEALVDVGERATAAGSAASGSAGTGLKRWLVVVKANVATLSALKIGANVVEALLERGASAAATVRQTAARILGGLAGQLDAAALRLVLARLHEDLGEAWPDVLAEILAALDAVVARLADNDNESDVFGDPSAAAVVARASPVLRNRHDGVQRAGIALLRRVASVAGPAVPAKEWMNVCYELLELQRSSRAAVRFEATAAFAAIAAAIGPAYVVATLIGHLRAPDRQFRVTTAAALAAAAEETGAFATLPVLMGAYAGGSGGANGSASANGGGSSAGSGAGSGAIGPGGPASRSQDPRSGSAPAPPRADPIVQQGVLKTLSFLFGSPGAAQPELDVYIRSIVPLIDDALLTPSQAHRQTAAAVVAAAARRSVGRGRERVFQHLLNELWPSILETSPHVVDRVREAVWGIGAVLGAPTLGMYLWAGLFHPARKVRTAYWALWSGFYAEHAAGLVAAYPETVTVPDLKDSSRDIRDVFI